jgi:hypothetical protein
VESQEERVAEARARHFVRGCGVHIEAGDEVEVVIEGYAYLVPFVESENEIFLKTIIPSRKASKQYVGESDEQT